MSEKYITVLTTTYPSELAIIRGRLEAEGIECFTRDEFTVTANPLYSNAVGGVKLQVKESDYEKALEIVNEDSKEDESLSSVSLIDNEAIEESESVDSDSRCPSCNSTEISKPQLSGEAFAISVLLLGFPIPFLKKTYHCFDCGLDFKLK